LFEWQLEGTDRVALPFLSINVHVMVAVRLRGAFQVFASPGNSRLERNLFDVSMNLSISSCDVSNRWRVTEWLTKCHVTSLCASEALQICYFSHMVMRGFNLEDHGLFQSDFISCYCLNLAID
jgi:hypothetical protein